MGRDATIKKARRTINQVKRTNSTDKPAFFWDSLAYQLTAKILGGIRLRTVTRIIGGV